MWVCSQASPFTSQQLSSQLFSSQGCLCLPGSKEWACVSALFRADISYLLMQICGHRWAQLSTLIPLSHRSYNSQGCNSVLKDCSSSFLVFTEMLFPMSGHLPRALLQVLHISSQRSRHTVPYLKIIKPFKSTRTHWCDSESAAVFDKVWAWAFLCRAVFLCFSSCIGKVFVWRRWWLLIPSWAGEKRTITSLYIHYYVNSLGCTCNPNDSMMYS